MIRGFQTGLGGWEKVSTADKREKAKVIITMTDAAIEHLLNVIDGGREQRQKEDAAVNKLLSMSDPSYRQPEHRDDAGVMQLVRMTNAQIRRENGGR